MTSRRHPRGGGDPAAFAKATSGTLGVAGVTTAAVVLSLLLAACSLPAPTTTLDGSSPEAFARTAAQAREELSAADRLAFDQALASVGSRRHSAADTEALRRTTFDGMTGAEIAEDHRRRAR